jgi:membrane protein DedA with SNARE-associated domain
VLVLASISGSLVNDTAHLVRDGGLPAIFALMAISSACIPLPSEVVMLFAGFAVADAAGSHAHHHLTMAGIILVGVAGAVAGSLLAYAAGRAGRLELVERHGAKFHIGPEQIARADRFFARYGEPTVLFGRMIPFVRAFVSLPAGIARMPVVRFTVLTTLGNLPWVIALAIAGHAVGHNWTDIKSGFEYVDYAVVATIVIGLVWWLTRWRSGKATIDTAA